MRGLTASVVVALSICGAALSAGWALQIGVLPPAARAERFAANTAAWFLRYRVVESSLRVKGRRESGLCLRSWFARPDGVLARGVLLVLGDGTRILDNGGPQQTVERPRVEDWRRRALLLHLAGCPGIVGKRLAADATDGTVSVERAYAAGLPALALDLPTQRERPGREHVLRDRLTVYVSARTYRPLAIAASFGAVSGVARIRLVKATAGVLERFAAAGPRTPATKP